MEGLAQFNQCLVLNLGCASPLARSLVPLLPVAGHDRLFLPGTAYRLRFVGGMDCGTHLIAPILERSEEHTSELQSLMRTSYDVFCLKKNKSNNYKLKPNS